jgi:orotidine-5'-phosphate decarboxylase
VAVTVLTSQACPDVKARVLGLARSACGSGIDGAVASVEECASIKDALGPKFLVVTPGIRPSGASLDDQKRVATPRQAREAGSDFIVVGRPIIAAPDPAAAALSVLKELKS